VASGAREAGCGRSPLRQVQLLHSLCHEEDNLVDNAIKFSMRAETRAIELSSRPAPNGGVRFSVRDFGPGIPANQMKKIFRLFYRAGNELTRQTVGTGIGLAIVHELSHAMGGKVDVANRDPGAEFTVALPAAS
jgi:signal transduction histidine kinase